jgi:hypothetical protein
MCVDKWNSVIQFGVDRGIRFNFAIQIASGFDYLEEAHIASIAEKATKVARAGAADISLLMNELVQLTGDVTLPIITYNCRTSD